MHQVNCFSTTNNHCEFTTCTHLFQCCFFTVKFGLKQIFFYNIFKCVKKRQWLRIICLFKTNQYQNIHTINEIYISRAENVVLPKNGYFGVSAATGGLADDHDVLKFITHSLRSPEMALVPDNSADAAVSFIKTILLCCIEKLVLKICNIKTQIRIRYYMYLGGNLFFKL